MDNKYLDNQVQESDDFFEKIKKFFMTTSRGESKVKFTYDSIEIFKLESSNSSNFKKYQNEERKLLWHVTPVTNFDSIVELGLTVS